jgi:hypothetical protein
MYNGTNLQMRNGTKKTLNTESKGTMIVEEEYGTLKYERRLSHPPGRRLQIQKRYSDGCLITKEPSMGTMVVQSVLLILYQDPT